MMPIGGCSVLTLPGHLDAHRLLYLYIGAVHIILPLTFDPALLNDTTSWLEPESALMLAGMTPTLWGLTTSTETILGSWLSLNHLCRQTTHQSKAENQSIGNSTVLQCLSAKHCHHQWSQHRFQMARSTVVESQGVFGGILERVSVMLYGKVEAPRWWEVESYAKRLILL